MGGQLIVGVGGTGQRIVGELKRIAGQSLPDSRRDMVKFLAIDCDVTLPDSELTEAEFLHLTIPDLNTFIEAHSVELEDWLDLDHLPLSRIRDLNKGAGQIREIGRLALFANLDVVLARIRSCLVELESSTTQEGALRTPATIIFCGSVAGGTGGGILLDLAAATRSIPEAVNFMPVAHILLPGVFRGMPATYYIEENTYAFLKELDYLLGYRVQDAAAIPPESLLVQSGRREYSLMYPFARVSLVDSENEDQVMFDMDRLAELIALAIATECQSAAGHEAANQWSLLRNKNTMELLPYPRNSPYWTFGCWPLEGVPAGDRDDDVAALQRAVRLSSPLLAYSHGAYDYTAAHLFGPPSAADALGKLLDQQLGCVYRVESPPPTRLLQTQGPLELTRLKRFEAWRSEYLEMAKRERTWSLHLDKRWEGRLPDVEEPPST